MAVVIGGAGLGNYDVLGQAGIKLSGTNGLNINASTGNLVIRGNDHSLVSRGLDLSLARTYNSQGTKSDFDGDNWRFSFEKHIKAVGNNLQLTTGDGHVTLFKLQEDGSYLSAAGSGAHDTIHKVGSNWVYTEGSTGITETYRASDGRLLSTEDKHGNKITYRYNGNQLAAISGASGEELHFIYNDKGQLTRLDSFTIVEGKLTHTHSAIHYAYDAQGRLAQVKVDLTPADKSIADGKVFTTTYTYQDANSHLLKTIQKSDGNRIDLAYQTVDGKVRLSRIDDNGIVTELNYQSKRANGHQLQVTDNNGEVWYYKHDDKGRLVSTLSPKVDYKNSVVGLPRGEGQQQGLATYQYDDQDNLIVVRDSTGREIQNKYDANGNLTEVLRNGVVQLKHEYSGNLLTASHTFNKGQKEASAFYVYENGKVRFEISAKGTVTEHSYNGFGERASMRRYAGANYTANAAPSLSAMVIWAGQQNKQQSELTEYTYQRGELYTQTTYNRLDGNGRGDTISELEIVSWGFDYKSESVPARGVYIDGKHAGGGGRGVTITVVDANNKLVSAKSFDTNGNADASAQLTTHLNTLKASTKGLKVIVTTSDEWVNRLGVDAKAALAAMGITKKTLDSAEIRSAFMAVVEAQDGNWVTTHEEYRPRYPASILNHKISNAEHVRTTYDAFGNLISTQTLTGNIKTGQVDVKSTTTQVYDGLNRVTSTTDGAGITTKTQYLDASRQVLVTTENGVTTRRTFSERGELISEIVSATGEASRERSYIYNASGQLVATEYANGSLTTQFYDDTGLLWISVSASGQVTEYQRDSEGRVIREIQYESALSTQNWILRGKLTVSGNDVLGLIDAGAQHRVIRTEFDALGRVHRVIDGEQQVTEYVYDNLDRQVKVRYYKEGFGQSARELNSKYDKAGKLTEQVDADGFIKRFFYDEAGNLVETKLYKRDTQHVFQDADEIRLDKWEVYDSSPAGATMTPRYDAEYGGHVIDLKGTGQDNGYRLSDSSSYKSWETKDARTISWDMKYSEGMTVYISLQTEKGHRYLQYHVGSRTPSIANGYANHGIGNVINGEWQAVTRDLEADLAAVEPDNKILHVNAFLIRGSGSIGQVSLTDEKPVQEHDRTQTFYDSRGRQQYVLDEQGYLTETRHLDGGREKVTYRYSKAVVSRDGGIETILRQAGTAKQLSRERFDAAGRLVSSTGMNSIETTYHYDSVTGLLRQQVTAANTNDSRSVYFDYNKFGELTGRVAVDGKQDWKAVNVSNLVDQRGTRSTYNVMGWKISDYHPATGRTEYQYDNAGRLIKTTDALGNTRSTRYTAFGQVKQSLAGGVVKVEYDYDRAGRVNREVDGERAVTTYIYNNQGQVQYQVRQHVSDVYQAFQSASGHLISRHVTQYHYDERGNVIERHTAQDYRAGMRISGGDTLTDVRSSTLRYQAQWTRKYDHQGRVVSEVDGAGKEKIIDYLHGGRIKTVKLSGALQERIELDALGRTLNIANGSGETTRYEYDDTRNTVTVVSPGGIRTTTEKNAHGETISITDGLGNQRLFHYNHNGQVVRTEFRAAGSSTSEVLSNKEYDANTGLLRFETNAEGTRTEIRYNAIGQQWKVIRDANGEKLQTEYGFDSQGQRIWEDTEGQRTYVRYDNNGQKVRVEQGGVATTYQYDVNGKVIRKVEGAVSGANVVREERVTEFNYDANGNLLAKRIKSGSDWKGTGSSHITRYSYDGAGNVVEKASGVGGVTRYIYDNVGRVKYEINALRYVTEFQYDNANRLTKTVRYNNAIANQVQWTESTVKDAIRTSSADRITELKYDNEGRIAYEIDGKGYATGYTYDANGQVIRTTTYGKAVSESGWNSASAEKRVSESIYDEKGRLQYTITAQGLVSERGYDKEGRITHTINYDTKFELASRSAASINALKSHLLAEVAAGNVRAELSVYDELGRKRFTLDADGYLIEYQYNRQSLKIRKREYVDNTAVLTALNDVRSGNANMTEYRVFVALAHSLQTLESASAELRAQLAELNLQQSRITGLFGELTTLEKQISETNNTNHDLGISIEHANSRLVGLQKEVEVELARHASLQKTINELAVQIKAHEDRLKGQNTQAVNEAKAVLDSAKAALNAANAAKAATAKKVRDQVSASVLTTLHPEWAADYTSTNGKIYKSVTTDAEANSALSLMSGHRSVLIKEKNALHQQYEAQLAKGENADATKAKLDKTIAALEFIDKLAADIQADLTARARGNNAQLAVTTAENAHKKALEDQSKTNGVINGNPTVEADNTSTAITKPTDVTEASIDIPVTPGSTTELLDKIDALKSKIQVLTADIDAQKSTVEIRAAELELRESEYAVARNAYNVAQAARQAEINAAQNAVNKAQSVLNSAWSEYNAAESSKKSHQDNQVAKQAAYNTAKTNYDNSLRAKNSAQTTANNANNALSSATSNAASKQTAYNTASNNYNYHHNEWVKADNHYNSTISSRDSAARHQENTRIAYVNANNDYNAYNNMSWGTEERPSGKTQSGLDSRRATRDARLRDYQSAINSYNYWVGQVNSAATNRTNKWNTRVDYLNLMNTAKSDLDTANSLKASAQTNSDKANQTLADASKAFDATKAPLTNATNTRDDANSALAAANTRFANATNAWKAAEADLAKKKVILQETQSTPTEQVELAKSRYDAAKAEKTAANTELQSAVELSKKLSAQRVTLATNVTNAQKTFDSVNTRYQAKKAEFDSANNAHNSAESNKRSKASSVTAAENNLASINRDIGTAQANYNTAVNEVSAAQSRVNSARSTYNGAQAAYETAVNGRHTNEEGNSWGTSISEINSRRATRDNAANALKASESELNTWVVKRNNAANDINRLNVTKTNEIKAVDMAKEQYNAALVSANNARNVFNAVSSDFDAISKDYNNAKSTLDSLLANQSEVEAQYAQALEKVKTGEAKLSAADSAYATAKATLDAMTSNVAGDANTVKYERETREALQLAQQEHNAAVSHLNTLQTQRDAALAEQTQLMQMLTGNGSGTLVDASIDSIDSAEALKNSAESSMISNRQKVESLKGQLKTLADSIETQRSELDRQQRIYGDKLNAHEASKAKVQALASKLALNEGSLYDADVQIMSWEEAKRSGAETITASEFKLSGQYLSKANAQNLFNSANALLSSNKSVQSQRKADRDAAQAALQQAKNQLATAITIQTNAINAVRGDNSWVDAIWLLDSDYRTQDATYQHRLNNKYRVLSEEQGGGSTGYTQAQIDSALNARNAALGRLNSFQAAVSNASSPIYTKDAQTALNSLNGQRGSIKLLSDLFYNRYKNALTAVHTNEEGNSSNAYTQSQINTFKAESDRAARAIQHLDNMRKKLTDNINANKARADLEAEVSRHTQIVVTQESLLVEATKKVDSAQADFNVATDSLNAANRALEAAKKDVADAHKAMDEVELHLNAARAHMDSVEDSIVTIRGHLDLAKTDESRALAAVVAARKELNVAQISLNVAKGDLNNTVKYLNTAYAELQSATKLHSQASAYLDRATVYKNRAGDTLSEAQQLVYLSTLSVTRDFNAGTVSNDTDYLYDARGQLISERSATISYAEISADGSVIQNIGRLETQHSYDSLGNVVATTTAVGTSMANTKRFVFNVMGDQTQSQGLAGSSVIYNDQNLATVNINAENGRRDRVYNQLGQLRFEIDEEGFVTEYRYNAFGQKLEQTRHSAPYMTARPNGKAVALADMESFVVNGGDNRTLRWTYDEAGQQIEVNQLSNQNALTIKDSVTFNAYGEKVATSRTYDGKAVTTAQQLYNGDGQLVFSMDAEGYVTKFVYNNFGELARQVEYQKAYQEPGKPVKTWSVTALNTWIAGPETGYTREVSYTYDNRGNTRTTTRHGVVYHVMNASNAVVEKKQDITTTTYHDFAGRMYMSVQEEGAVNAANHNKAASRVLYEYDALGRLVSSWGKEREYVLTGLGIAVGAGDKPTRLVARQRTDYLYDAQGNQISTMTEGRSTFQYFNAQGKLTGRKDAEGNYTAIQTDAMNRIKSETQKVATTGALAYSYDKVTSYEYDKTGRQTSTSVNSSSGVIKEVADYNAFGELTSKRHVALGIDQIQETYQYDGFGRVENATRKGVETTYQYNWMDKVTVETTGGTRVISREYDNLGNMVIEHGVTFDGKKPLVEQDFDRYGNVLYRITNGARYDFKYNHANQVIEQQAPEVDTVDNKGNVAKRRPVTKMYYDANGNRIAVQDANGNWQKSLYDTAGQKLADINGVGGTTHYYSNAHGEMVGRINTMNQGEMFTYDNNGQLLTRSRLNLSQHYIEVYAKYAYDQAGQRYSEEWVGETGYTQWTKFDQAGRVMETLGGGQHRRYSYDSFGNKTREAWLEGGVEKASKGATFDGYGRQKIETWLDGTVITYTYNTKGELTRKHGGGMDMSFEYFDNGLLKKQTVGSKSETYVYDANGKQTQRTLVEGGQQLTTNTTWDSHGRLATISTTTPKGYDKTLDTSSVTYTYDAVGNRRKVVSKRGANAAETRWYRYDGDNRIHESHVGATDEGNVDNKVGSRRIRYNAVGQKSEEFNWISRSGASQAILEKSGFGYDVNGHLNSIRSYEYAGSTAYVTRHLTQTNSRTGHAIEQNEITTSYSYSSGLIQKDTGKTKTKRTDFVYDEGRLRTQDVYEDSNRTYGITFDYHFSGQMAKQQTNYVKEKFTETLSYTYQGKESFRKTNIATTRNQTGWKAGSTDFKYNAAGHLYEVTSTKSDSARKVLSDFNGQVALQLAGGKLSAELAVGGNPVAQLSETKLNADLLSDSAATTGAQPGAYTVQQNDSLQRIAQTVYGDSRYWYLIADANGISPNDKLTAGKSLVIPNQHTQTYNGAESFKPYNESEVLGNVNPDPIAPPPPKKSCNPVAMIVMAVVAVVVTVYTAGAAATLFAGGSLTAGGVGAAGMGALAGTAAGSAAAAGTAALVAGAAVGGAVGAAASQLVGMGLGVVDEFSWDQVVLGGLAAGATAGMGAAFSSGGVFGAVDDATNLGLRHAGNSMVNSAANYTTNYLGSKALGNDVSFSWTNLAASAAGSVVSLGASGVTSKLGIVGDTLSGFAGAATSSALRGESFRDNAGQMMTDAFGNALSNVATRGSREEYQREIEFKERLKQHSLDSIEARMGDFVFGGFSEPQASLMPIGLEGYAGSYDEWKEGLIHKGIRLDDDFVPAGICLDPSQQNVDSESYLPLEYSWLETNGYSYELDEGWINNGRRYWRENYPVVGGLMDIGFAPFDALGGIIGLTGYGSEGGVKYNAFTGYGMSINDQQIAAFDLISFGVAGIEGRVAKLSSGWLSDIIPNRVTPYGTTIDFEFSALRRFGANNSSVSSQIRNERINLGLYKDVIEGDVSSLISKLDVSAAPNTSVFWSGDKGAAIDYANSNGKVVLETTFGGRLVDGWSLLNKALPWNKGGEEFWTGLSEKYARGTSGDISIIQTPERALSGTGFDWKGGYVWQNYEKPVIETYIDTGRVGKIDYQLAPNERYPLSTLLGNEF
ncbi:LysM peptidoglycan-binding domain-containing protein [Vibrio mimicus]